MDGRKSTGGKLEVRVKIKEPLSGVELHPVTEKWLVLEPVSSLSPPERQKERVSRVFSSAELHVCRPKQSKSPSLCGGGIPEDTGRTRKLITNAAVIQVKFTRRILLCDISVANAEPACSPKNCSDVCGLKT